MQSKAL